jgi:hypothetical protein
MLRDPDMCKVNLGSLQQNAAVAGWGSECVFGFRVGASMIPETVFRIAVFFYRIAVFFYTFQPARLEFANPFRNCPPHT